MGYSHGVRWTEDKIINEIHKIMDKLEIDTMPTKTQMDKYTGSYALSNAITKRGGTYKYADILGLEVKSSESNLGEKYELICLEHINKLGMKCEKMQRRYPYDLLVCDIVKIDVKASNIFSNSSSDYHTFNIEKIYQTCDIFVCYCLDNNGDICKTYVIPSSILNGKTQLSIGIISSKYDRFIDRWDLIYEYTKFNEMLTNL